MAVNNTLAPTKAKNKMTFSQAIEKDEVIQKLIKAALSDPKRASRFCAALVSTVAANPILQECDFVSVVSAGLQGEALELSPSPTLGEYYIVPYKKSRKNPETNLWETYYVAQFQIGTAGRVQLALRSGQYKSLFPLEIREGEYFGRDSETGKLLFRFVKDEDEREKLPIVGYCASFELINGFRHSEYFTVKKCMEWAERYSKSFDRDLFDRFKSGAKITDKDELRAIEAPWYKHTDEMCKNLVLRRALKNAPKSVEMRNLIEADDKTEAEMQNDALPQTKALTTQETVEKEFFTAEQVTDVPDEQPASAPKKSAKKTEQTTIFDGDK